jgi:hypothetical protein
VSDSLTCDRIALQIGISVTSTSEQVGVFALAYAVHKAASPIRFPPTVALTPIVARWMGKDVSKETAAGKEP